MGSLLVFCDTLSGFVDFENPADRRLGEDFGPDLGLFVPGRNFGFLWSVFVSMLAEYLCRKNKQGNGTP